MNKIVSNIAYEQLQGLIPALFYGAVLGVFFFAGLWWTVRQGAKSKHPVIWFLSSFVLRSTLTLFAIYWITGGQWSRLLVCMLGFTLARIIVLIITRYSTKRAVQQESAHAP
ncbi:ATP synthase subunit I [Psychromonas sp. MB-3u-54]|uniref:ATP synthase subunit I n=1 Tax=Psychromonas sp. MB-3u-54 TaxID=2058319 RepID=UPI000C33684F|nr:ATP synthase subunit I [Psychromonas sp. MB-3u-54]PKH03959.1 ATP synthase subunit I [Psychromonas sp. MB-3u-54]